MIIGRRPVWLTKGRRNQAEILCDQSDGMGRP
jgi:hypothetical protein